MAISSSPLAPEAARLCSDKQPLTNKWTKARREILEILPFTSQFPRLFLGLIVH